MKFKIREQIKALEDKIFRGYSLWIFKGYVAIDKRGAEKIIDEIYESLPQDVMVARQYLKNHSKPVNIDNSEKKSSVYDILKNLEILLENFTFLSYSIVDKKEFEQINDELKNSIPEEIYQAEKYDK